MFNKDRDKNEKNDKTDKKETDKGIEIKNENKAENKGNSTSRRKITFNGSQKSNRSKEDIDKIEKNDRGDLSDYIENLIETQS